MASWTLRGGMAALVVAVSGAIVLVDTLQLRSASQDFVANGVPAVATNVELRVDHGKGGTFVDTVDVTFSTVQGAVVKAELTGILGDAEGAEPGHRSPAAGTRYAPPLDVLYKPGADKEVMAVVDAKSHADVGETLWIAEAMLFVGILGLGAAWVVHLRRERLGWRFWRLRQARRH